MVKLIYLDLDGPILDGAERHYTVYQDILVEQGYGILQKDEYWRLKKLKTPVEKILDKTCNKKNFYDYFLDEWNQRIEDKNYLKFDKIRQGILPILEFLKQKYFLILITLRTNPDNLMDQLKRLSLRKYFNVILTHTPSDEPWKLKIDLLQSNKHFVPSEAMIVWDTEADILAGKKLGIITVGVLNGIRSRELIEEMEPNYLIKELEELLPILERV